MLVSYNESNLFILIISVIICILVCLYSLNYARKMRRWDARKMRWANQIFRKIRSDAALFVNREETVDYLTKQLRKPEKLIALRWMRDNKTEKLSKDHLKALDEIIASTIARVCTDYVRMGDGIAGYLIQQIEYFNVRKNVVNEFLLALIQRNIPAVLIVAMRGVAFTAHEDTMTEALVWTSTRSIRCSDKLITDTLNAYTGDHISLNKRIVEVFPAFRVGAQRAIISYWEQGKNVCVQETVYALLLNEETNMEVRIAAIKYFGFVADERAMQYMVAAMKQDETPWEVKVNCAKSLAIYRSLEITETLAQHLGDRNWYIRNNCATTLVNQDVQAMRERLETLDDPYATDIVRYALDLYDKHNSA